MEEKEGGEKVRMGMVVNDKLRPTADSRLPRRLNRSADAREAQVIRGNSVVMLEALERIGADDKR